MKFIHVYQVLAKFFICKGRREKEEVEGLVGENKQRISLNVLNKDFIIHVRLWEKWH